MFKLKRAYEKAEPEDGARFLVDRLWPRGISKAALKIEGWLKEAAPSDELRHWFHAHPEKWEQFRERYNAELDDHPEAWSALAEAEHKGPVTLVYSARDTERNNAAVLAEYVRAHGGRRPRGHPR